VIKIANHLFWKHSLLIAFSNRGITMGQEVGYPATGGWSTQWYHKKHLTDS